MPRRTMLAWLGATALAFAALGGAWFVSFRPSDVPGLGSGIGGAFSLTDGDGRRVTDRDLRGRFALVYFGYTFCPDICPTTLSQAVAALEILGPKAARVQPVFISIDPQRDTPAVVRDYVAAFSPKLLGLTGTADEVATAARAFRVYYAPHRTGDEPNYTVDHSSILYLMDPNGELRALIRTDQTTPEMAAEIGRNL